MTVDVRNLAAVTEKPESGILGFLTWYTISEKPIMRDDIEQCLKHSGIDTNWMPPPVRVPDAFRRATSSVQRKRVPTNDPATFENYLCRDVSTDRTQVQRNVVVEVVNSQGKRLDYRTEEAVLILDKESGTIKADVEQYSRAVDMVNEAIALFEMFKTHHDSMAIRLMALNYLKSLSPTSVKPSGGVYFIPEKYEGELEKLVTFLQSLPGGSEAFMIPLIDSKANKDMVRKKLHDNLKDTLQSLKDGILNTKLDRWHTNQLLDEAKRKVETFREYQDLLNDELEDMDDVRKMIHQQMLKLVDKLTDFELKKV